MLSVYANLLSSGVLVPQGESYAWQRDLITLHAASDGIIALASYSIPLAIVYFLYRRPDLPFRGLFWLCGGFWMAAATTRLLEVLTVWTPAYWLLGSVKAVAALLSIATAVALFRIMPQALKAPSPDELRRLNEDLEDRVRARTADLTGINEKLEQEIQQRHDAEEEVRRLNDSLQNRVTELQTLLDLLPVGIAIAQDASGREMRTNQTFARLMGISSPRKASLSAPPIEVPTSIRIFQGDREITIDQLPLQRAVAENRVYSAIELRIVRADGQEIAVLASAMPLRDAAGNARGAVATMQDITAQKQEGEERVVFERRLQEAQKLESLGVLAGGIAHDFNNLLTGILGNASLARLDLPPGHATVRGSLDNLEQAAMRAAELCKQMLAYAGKGRFVIQPLSLSRLVRETADLLEVSLGRKSVLQLALEDGLPAFQGDGTQVRQVLMNLVINASEALGEKGGVITIRTGRIYATRDYLENAGFSDGIVEGDYVYAEVGDTGCGMDQATVTRIFDPFFTTKFTGRGLGLAAVLGIVRGHRGAIKVYSEPGHGTLFKVFFPALPGGPATPPEPMAHAVLSEEKHSGVILVADDEETVRDVAIKVLESAGYTVVTAIDGVEAVEVFGRNPARFNAVLLDLTMPRMDGEAALEALRAVSANVCVLLMSGFSEQDTLNRFVGRGIAGFLPKPFSAEMLLTKLKDALSKQSAG